jgi:hypothetical protein
LNSCLLVLAGLQPIGHLSVGVNLQYLEGFCNSLVSVPALRAFVLKTLWLPVFMWGAVTALIGIKVRLFIHFLL